MERTRQHGNHSRLLTSTFPALSDELKLEIFHFIRSRDDQGNARLVSRDWDRLMRPRMWRKLSTDMESIMEDESIELLEQHACFRDIRVLTVCAYPPTTDALFSRFMHLLGDDQLLEYNGVKHSPLSLNQLHSLLRHQSKLRSFCARFDFSKTATTEQLSSWRAEEETALFTTSLRSLRSLRIYFRDGAINSAPQLTRQNWEVTCSIILINCAPLLDSLEIFGLRSMSSLLGGAPQSDTLPRTLTRILLADVDLSGLEERLAKAINLFSLRSLTIEYCKALVPFVQALATSIQYTGAELKVLTIRTQKREKRHHTRHMHHAVQDLLSSFEGLENLELDFGSGRSSDWEANLAGHHTLKRLLVSYRRMDDHLGRILEQCPNVRYFAYKSLSIALGDVADCQLPSTLPIELCAGLDAIAAAPTITTLRMLYAPGFGDDRANTMSPAWIEKAGRLAHRVATLVLTHLHLNLSNVKMLALSPTLRWENSEGDGNLHYYPHYFYKLRISNIDGRDMVEAAPLRNYAVERPAAADFAGPGNELSW
ncbi:hypothetical protein BDV96DRAFT_597845 [Lophiotrema nucula]|uniref:Uncharacterized protein n=1 Tax=Lophiotrema nucula TaxID=690887 RepID=A0A6A5ZHW3_9PLEO|nr:hypothetical protein BDV96DRAFT_597845 [Lophiotrema nucula]